MKKKKSRLILVIVSFAFFLTFFSKVEAISDNLLQTEQTQYQLGETINISLNREELSCAAMDATLYYDASRLDYIAGPENVNVLENEIKFTWFDENGGQGKSNVSDITFEFSAKKEGKAVISLVGNFYDSTLKELVVPSQEVSLQIGEQQNNQLQEVITEEEGQEQSSEEKGNAKLASLRISEEGLSPYFSPDEKNYIFVTDQNITSLGITAIPQNKKASVHVQGNSNFKMGENIITIEVIAEDKTQKEEYSIQVIRSTDLAKANVNLETLAIESSMLYPSYDNQVNQYTAEVSNTTQNLNLLAIPENAKAVVTVEGKDNLKIGDNLVTIHILGEDGITDRTVLIKVHRRTEEEEASYEEEKQVEAKRLEAILEGEEEKREEEQEKKQDTTWIPFFLILILVIFLTAGVILWDKIKYKEKAGNPKEKDKKKNEREEKKK